MRYRWSVAALILLLACLPAPVHAQARVLTGVVSRAEDGAPLAEAVVTLAGRPSGAKTDGRGHFSLEVPTGPTRILVRAIGYKRMDVPIGTDQAEVTVAMIQDVFNLEEVVVTGQATEMEQRNSTTSTAVVDGQDVSQVQAQSVDRALQGRVAGANIQTNSGAPGAASRSRSVGRIRSSAMPSR